MSLRISEVAERSGVPSSTLRYYERIGLLEPKGRSANGYREYDEATLERLAFIGRAKRLGMNLDDVAALGEAWFSGDCRPVQAQLRAFVVSRLADLRRQMVEDSAFARELERMLGRLTTGPAGPERCGPDCGCDTDPLQLQRQGNGPAFGCSLSQGEAIRQVGQWRRLVRGAEVIERSPSWVRMALSRSPDTLAAAARLCAAETACCPFFEFNLEITAASAVLTISAPPGAADLLDRFVDLIQVPSTTSFP